MKNIVKIFFLIIALNGQLGFSQDELIVSSSISKDTIGFFDVLTFTIEFNNRNADLINPVFKDFEIYQTNNYHNVTITGGVSKAKITRTYLLKPKKTGVLNIESVIFEYEGGEYKTNPLTVLVKGNTVENDPFNKENNIFIIAEISNYEPYKYQQISVIYKLYYDNNIQPSSIDFDFEKEYLREFYLYALSTNDSVFKENFNSKEYNCKIIKNDVLRFKENYHTYIHNKIKVSYDEIIASQENQTLKKSINTILPVVSERIKVKNFQTNYKFPHEIKSFGDYKLDVIIPDKSEYKKGKIFEVVVQLYGDGFLEDNVIPNLYIHEAFETVSNTLKNERTLENGKIKTVAIRTYKLKAVYEGKYTFYPASFYFYNEITNEKKAIYSKEFTIQVK